MKKTTVAGTKLICCFFFLGSILPPLNLSAQVTESPIKKIYLLGGAGGTSHKGISGDFSLHTVLNNKWSATASYHKLSPEPKNLPGNYDPGYSILIILPIENPTPTVDIYLISVSAGKYLRAGRRSWFNLEAGLSYVSGETARFTPVSQSSGYLLIAGYVTSNYETTKEKKSGCGGLFRIDYQWAFSSFSGLGLGAFASLNPVQSAVGLQLSLVVGKMNREKK